MNPADTNPITKPYCQDCKYWEPVGFYRFEREADPNKRKCKHLQICKRVYQIATESRQMQLSDFIATP